MDPSGERVHRVVQREVEGRGPEPGELRHVGRSKGDYRGMAQGVQPGAAPQFSGLSPTGAGSDPAFPVVMGHGNGTGGKLKDSLYIWYKQWGQVIYPRKEENNNDKTFYQLTY